MSNTLQDKVEQFKRQELATMLAQCTQAQQTFFHQKAFPKGVPADAVDVAYDLCERTIRKNAGRRTPDADN